MTAEELIWPSRWILIVWGIIIMLAAFVTKWDAGFLLSLLFTFVVPPMIPLVIGLYWKRATAAGAFWSVLLSFVAGVVWTFHPAHLWMSVHMMWIAIGVGLVTLIVVSLFTKPKYFATLRT